MGLPLDDWQFWAATAIALGSLVVAARPFLPRRGKAAGPCPGCPSGSAAQRPKRTSITIEGSTIKGRRS